MNTAGMIRRKGKRYMVTRESGRGAYSEVDGKRIAPEKIQIPVIASVQPATPEDLISLPEGADRTVERKRFYSVAPLQTNRTEKLLRGDLVEIQCVDFRVESVIHWDDYSMAVVVIENTNVN